MIPAKNQNKEKMLTIETQSCDGLTTARCPEFGIVGFGKTPDNAMREVFDAVITNSRIIIQVQKKNPSNLSSQELTLARFADTILRNQGNIQSLFEYRSLNASI